MAEISKYEKVFCALHDKGVLTWCPWVGEQYSKGGLLVVAESNYAKDDKGNTPDAAVACVNGNRAFTKEVVDMFCLSRKKTNKTFDGVTYILMQDDDDIVKKVSRSIWNSVAFMDVIQCAMKGIGWKEDKALARNNIERPARYLWKPGWEALVSVVKVLEPSCMLFVGSSLAYMCNKVFLPKGVAAEIKKRQVVGKRLWLRTGWMKVEERNKVAIISIPNPGGAHGFSLDLWRKAVKDEMSKVHGK